MSPPPPSIPSSSTSLPSSPLASPLVIARYIQLAVPDGLDKAHMRQWLRAAQQAAPSGVLASVQTVDDQGSRRSVGMVHQEGKAGHRYRIPLTRDLRPEEVQRIVEAFAAAAPDLDFDIETNQSQIEPRAQASLSDDDARHIALCTALAKARHATWMSARLAAGWRFGTQFSMAAKTHPLLRPWEQLPDLFRQPDLTAPQAMLDLMQDNDYVVIARDALDALKAKASI